MSVRVSAAWGSFWYLDETVRSSGDSSAYGRLADGPLDVLSSDLPFTAYDAIDAVQNTRQAVELCRATAAG